MISAKKKVLVTGASGFIASHVVPALMAAGYDVIGIDRLPCTLIGPSDRFTFTRQDIDTLERLPADVHAVIHLAFETYIPQCIEDPVGTTYNNVDLGVKMLELSKRAGVRKFLYPSTASLYGNQPTPWKETLPATPTEPYSLQKYVMERFIRYYAQNGLPGAVFRLFQVFGENQRQDQALAKFYRCRKEGKPITVMTSTKDSTDSARRDFVYAGDIAQAFCLGIGSDNVGKGEVINISSGYNYTIREIAEIISPKIEYIPKRSFDLDIHLADVTLAKELLGWQATTDIKDWLRSYLKTL